jgi:hypothetical protein
MKPRIVLFSLVAVLLAAWALHADVKDNSDLRRHVRGNAYSWGFNLSNVVTIVDANRKRVILGGTMGTTQELGRLIAAMSNFWPKIQYIDQSVTTPEGNPFPASYHIGEGRVIKPVK